MGLYSLEELKKGIEELPDPSAFVVYGNNSEANQWRELFPIYTISTSNYWPVKQYEFSKPTPRYIEIPLDNIGVTIRHLKPAQAPDELKLRFIEDHSRTIERAYDTYCKKTGMMTSAPKSVLNSLGQKSNITLDIFIEVYDGTRNNQVITHIFKVLPPRSPLTLIGDQSGKGTVEYDITFPIVYYKCE